MKLYKRQLFDQLLPYLGDQTIIVIHGARQVGKTHLLTYLKQHLENQHHPVYYYDLEYPALLTTLNQGIDPFIRDLAGRGHQPQSEAYILIDEIQYLDNPSSFLKLLADHHQYLHLVVSGSSSFDLKTKFTDSLVGRTVNFVLYPLSFPEFLIFKNSSLKLTPQPSPAVQEELTTLFTEFVLYGGYPQIVLEPVVDKKLKKLAQIIDTYVRKDLRDLGSIEDLGKFNQLLQLLAHQSGQLISYTQLGNTTKLAQTTLRKYLHLLEETYVIKLVTPYSHSPNVEISKNPKVFFFDSGLQSLLWLNQFSRNLQGNLLETNIFAELVKLYDCRLLHFWRTKGGVEVDFILDKPGELHALEVKTTFPRTTPPGLRSFLDKYSEAMPHTVALTGEPGNHALYPWQLQSL